MLPVQGKVGDYAPPGLRRGFEESGYSKPGARSCPSVDDDQR